MKSSAELQASGAFVKNPNRRRVDPESHGDLGNAPSYFTEPQRKIWKELKAQVPEGVARVADRSLFEVLCRLMSKYREKELTGVELSLMITSLSKLGMTPADRRHCAAPPSLNLKKNEFSEFAAL